MCSPEHPTLPTPDTNEPPRPMEIREKTVHTLCAPSRLGGRNGRSRPSRRRVLGLWLARCRGRRPKIRLAFGERSSAPPPCSPQAGSSPGDRRAVTSSSHLTKERCGGRFVHFGSPQEAPSWPWKQSGHTHDLMRLSGA